MTQAKANPLPVESGRKRGYEQASVDAFMQRARAAFDTRDGTLTSSEVRDTSFPLVKGGYRMPVVDAALARLEETLARREKAAGLNDLGADAWLAQWRAEAAVLLTRARRPVRERFRRAGRLRWGYNVAEVDAVCDRIAAFITAGSPLTVAQVRSVAFTMQHRGYEEAQVDAFLDATIATLLAVQ